jgi:hypothetical protein
MSIHAGCSMSIQRWMLIAQARQPSRSLAEVALATSTLQAVQESSTVRRRDKLEQPCEFQS